MEFRDWNTLLMPYDYAVEELKVKFRNVRREMRDRGEYSPIEFVTGRVKKISSILDKAKKLGIDIMDVEEKMEDIAGIRIMCQFVQDIYMVAYYIKARRDMTVLYEKDYIKKTKSSGYRSYHMIIKYPVCTVHGTTEVLAEIQIRTLSMNFWATIEHSLRYKYSNGVPAQISARLRSAADAAFLLDQEMSEISGEIMNAQVMFELQSVNTKDILDMIGRLREQGYAQEARYFQDRLEQGGGLEDPAQLSALKDRITEFLYRIANQSCGD